MTQKINKKNKTKKSYRIAVLSVIPVFTFLSSLLSNKLIADQNNQNEQSQSYNSFTTTLKYYDETKKKAQDLGKKINSDFYDHKIMLWRPGENNIGYLLNKKTYDYHDHELFREEIKALNLFNQLCCTANNNKNALSLIKTAYSQNFQYYNKADELSQLLKNFYISAPEPNFSCINKTKKFLDLKLNSLY